MAKIKKAATQVLIWNKESQQWELWNERALWKSLRAVVRANTMWKDIE